VAGRSEQLDMPVEAMSVPESSQIDESLNEMRAGTERGMRELADMREQLGQMRHDTQRELKEMHDLTHQVSEMRNLVRDEVIGLRETLDELSYLRKTSDRDRGRVTQMQLKNRARVWAKRNGLDANGPFLRVARLRSSPAQSGGQVWEFPVDMKVLGAGRDLTVLCEGRPDQDEDDFVALQIPARYLADELGPVLKMAGPRSVCQVSAEHRDFLQGINCPGVDLAPFVHGLKRRA
jgi:hypothetical protein